jgi:hypothetical protein
MTEVNLLEACRPAFKGIVTGWAFQTPSNLRVTIRQAEAWVARNKAGPREEQLMLEVLRGTLLGIHI